MSTNAVPTELLNSTAVREEKFQRDSIPAAWVLSGQPETKSKLLGKTADRLAFVTLWECGSVNFTWHYAKDESYVVLSGEACITNQHGVEQRFAPGDFGFFPAGTTAHWRVPDHFRKVAFVKGPVWLPFALALKARNKLLGMVSGSHHASL